jgi:hypothetical protein
MSFHHTVNLLLSPGGFSAGLIVRCIAIFYREIVPGLPKVG